jgi:hypothetical protein
MLICEEKRRAANWWVLNGGEKKLVRDSILLQANQWKKSKRERA